MNTTMILRERSTKREASPSSSGVRALWHNGRYAALLVCWLGSGFGGPPMLAQNFGEWGAAQNLDPLRLGLNTPVNDGCPMESPDGHMLFIASDRGQDLDVWVASRDEAGGWQAPERLPFPVNVSPGTNDFCPTPLPGNGLLFVSTRANNCGGAGNNADIYYTQQHPVKGWLLPQPLPCTVNSGGEEFSPSIVESEGMTMLFFSSNRGGGTQEIYMSTLSSDGAWTEASAVTELNWSGAQDARPNVRKDGLEIVFDSTRMGGAPDIFTAHRSSVYEPWSTPVALGSNVNSPAAETRPTISRDGKRLYFGSTRANQPGDRGGDIFMSTRSRQ